MDDVVALYLGEKAEHAAMGFIDALEGAYAHIQSPSSTGLLRYARDLDLPGPRFWPLTRYAHLVFYVEAKITSMSGAYAARLARHPGMDAGVGPVLTYGKYEEDASRRAYRLLVELGFEQLTGGQRR